MPDFNKENLKGEENLELSEVRSDDKVCRKLPTFTNEVVMIKPQVFHENEQAMHEMRKSLELGLYPTGFGKTPDALPADGGNRNPQFSA